MKAKLFEDRRSLIAGMGRSPILPSRASRHSDRSEAKWRNLAKFGMTGYLLLVLVVCGCQEEASSSEYEADAKQILNDIINYRSPENGGTENGEWGTENGSTENGSTENGSTENGSTENGSTENGEGRTENGSTENGERENGERENGERENGERENGERTATAAEPSAGNPVSPTSAAETSSDDCCVFESTLRTSPPLVIIKTNLLYDVALTPSLGVEVPLGERYSVEVDFMRGWWLRRDWSFCWQLEAASLEGRYWFVDRAERYRQGGWYAGILLQGAFYDFQLHSTRGVQGESMMAGVTGGYLYPLRHGWSLEFSFGLGYLRTNYRRYTVQTIHNDEHELVKSAPSLRLQGIFPLKAGVSLQWAIPMKSKRRIL
jgi:hypothetical protein